jgi:hypothetical protein
MALNDGKLAEMVTGEGKTLVAVLPVYLNALSGDSAFVVTTSDYLGAHIVLTFAVPDIYIYINIHIYINVYVEKIYRCLRYE